MSGKNGMLPPERNYLILGFLLVGMGVIFLLFYSCYYGTPFGPIVLALAMGIYFSGINLMLNSTLKRDPKLQEISDKIDALKVRLDELNL
jgi:hypothetical protein